MDVDFLVKNKEFLMNNTIKMFGVIALIAVAAFTMTTCKSDDPAEEDTGHTHEWGAWTVVTASTFITEGVETRTCTLDASHKETRSVDPLPIKNTADWTTALSLLNGKTGSFTLNIGGSFGVAATNYNANTFGITSGSSVTLKGSGKMSLTSLGGMFNIGAGQTFVIDSAGLTFEGRDIPEDPINEDTNYRSVVYIDGGTFELKNGKITGNASNSSGGGVHIETGTFTMSGGAISNNSGGGGVQVQTGTFTFNGGTISGNTGWGAGVRIGGGTFIMNSGTISGNENGTFGGMNNHGGGVYVSSGTFTMNGGIISGNTARGGSGGGVYFIGSGIFTMNGGTISGNSVTAGSGGGVFTTSTFRIVNGTIYGTDEPNIALRNTVSGGSTSALSGTVQYGTFNGSTWNSNGSLSSSNNTIKVVNGVLQ
jgi:hypothetical protein